MEKKKFENPILEIIYFDGDLVTDIINTSGEVGDWGDNPPGGDFDD